MVERQVKRQMDERKIDLHTEVGNVRYLFKKRLQFVFYTNRESQIDRQTDGQERDRKINSQIDRWRKDRQTYKVQKKIERQINR
jgi:hypothetical protein